MIWRIWGAVSVVSMRVSERSEFDPSRDVTESFVADVTALVREVADVLVVPRFGRLIDDEVARKDGGEITTVVDLEVERELTLRLGELAPGVPVVGEELASSDPSILDTLAGGGAVWIVDPLDGTSNYAAGDIHHGTMVGLQVDGTIVAAWSWHAATDVMHVLEPAGVLRHRPDGVVEALPRFSGAERDPVAVVKYWYAPEPWRSAMRARRDAVASLEAPGSAASEYPLLLDGSVDVLIYGRVRPWDHAPGCAMVSALGGVAVRLDGAPYVPSVAGPGLIVARSAGVCAQVTELLGI